MIVAFKMIGGYSSIANPEDTTMITHTNVEVYEHHVQLSRMLDSKLHVIDIPHDGSIGYVGNICNNYTQLDNNTFKTLVRITN